MRHLCIVLALAGCGAENMRGGFDLGGGGGDGGGSYDGGGGTDAGVCQSTNVTANPTSLPVDIIWVIDNSGSMDEEESYVQTNINTFSSQIASSGIDYRVVMITDPTHINVPPPLGGSNRFQAVNQNVQSNDALQLFISTYPQWQGFLRAGAVKHIVIVSDDESDMKAANFKTAVMGLTNPGFPQGFVLHAIVAETPGFTGFPPVFDHCFGKAAAVGQTYLDLQKQTMGVFASLCDTNWAPVFTALATAVTKSVQLPCVFAIPPPPMGQTLDLNAINLVFSPTGGMPLTVPYVMSMANCPPTGGWYFDNPSNPTVVMTCPATCMQLEADKTGSIQLAFGCTTVIP
jgi:hypothetical protein